jgi:hypothetical protein
MEIKTKPRKFARATETKTERGSRKDAQAYLGAARKRTRRRQSVTSAAGRTTASWNNQRVDELLGRGNQGRARHQREERVSVSRANARLSWAKLEDGRAGRAQERAQELGQAVRREKTSEIQRDAAAGAHRKERACDTGTTREDARAGARLGHQGTGETPASSASCARRKQRQGSELGDTRGWEKGLGRAGMRP